MKKHSYFLENSQYFYPTSMVMAEEIITKNQNEMTSDISTIAPDHTLTELEKTISTEPKFGFFDRQMAELEPKVCCLTVMYRTLNNNQSMFTLHSIT